MNWKPISELTEEHKDGRTLLFSNKERWFRLGNFEPDGILLLRESGHCYGYEPWRFSEIELPELPKSEFIITEKDVGRKVKTRCGKIGIVLYFDKNDISVYVGFISCAPIFTTWYFRENNGKYSSKIGGNLKIIGWAD